MSWTSSSTYRSLHTVESEDDVGDGRCGTAHQPDGAPAASTASATAEVEVVHLQLAAFEDNKVTDALPGVQVAVAELHTHGRDTCNVRRLGLGFNASAHYCCHCQRVMRGWRGRYALPGVQVAVSEWQEGDPVHGAQDWIELLLEQLCP